MARFEALHLAMAALASITGRAAEAKGASLSASADLAGAISSLPRETSRRVLTECDSIVLALTAGLVALERARMAGRLNLSAAQLLYDESRAAMAKVRDGVLSHA